MTVFFFKRPVIVRLTRLYVNRLLQVLRISFIERGGKQPIFPIGAAALLDRVENFILQLPVGWRPRRILNVSNRQVDQFLLFLWTQIPFQPNSHIERVQRPWLPIAHSPSGHLNRSINLMH